MIDLKQGEQKNPEFLKLNPNGKLPVLVDGELVLSESAAICTYIGERFPASGLVPPLEQSADRAHYFQWCFFAMSELEAPLWTMSKHARLLPEEQRIAAIAPVCVREFDRVASVLAQHMESREYAVGMQFTAADILLGGTLNWARALNIAMAALAESLRQAYVSSSCASQGKAKRKSGLVLFHLSDITHCALRGAGRHGGISP